MLRAAFIMCALEAGVPLREVQIAARHADPGPRRCMTTAAGASTVTPPTWWSPSPPAADLPWQTCRRRVPAARPCSTNGGLT
jgi:hypothetical protein